MGGSLKEKTVIGLAWSTIDNLARYVVSFVVSIVLARLLSPDEYGLIGLISVFIVISNTFINSGLSNALIRKNNITNADYNTVFSTNVGLSVVLYLALFFSAPAIANFFRREELVSLTRVVSIGIIIGSFSIVQQVKLTKLIDFKTQTKITFISSLSSGLIGILLAVCGKGVWALVFQQLSSVTITAVLLIAYNKWVPKLVFSKNSFSELFGFGWKLLVSNLIDSIWKEAYQLVIGKCYSPATLGHYTRAKQFADLFSINITAVVQRVTFPVLSTIQDDKKRLKRAYVRLIRNSMLLSFTLMFGLAAIARPLILSLLGEKWLPAVPFLQILCISSVLYPLHAINLNLLQVKGRSDIYLYLEIVKKAIAIIPIILGVFCNIYWMLWGSVLVGIVSYIINAYYSGRFISYGVLAQVKDLLPSFITALIMALLVYGINLLQINHFLLLVIQLIVGIVSMLLLCELFKLPEYKDMKGIVLNYLHRNK